MIAWKDLPEEQKDAARARYQAMKEHGVGTFTVMGQEIEIGPMDPAAKAGLTVDEYLEKLHGDMPRMLELAKKLAPLAKRLGVMMGPHK